MEERDLLSTGWQEFAASKFWPRPSDEDGEDFSAIQKDLKEVYSGSGWNPTTSSHSLRRFLGMEQGDRVVVPTWGAFHVYEVVDNETLVSTDLRDDIVNVKSWWKGKTASVQNGYITEDDSDGKQGNQIDLGFFRRVRKIKRDIPRAGYADVDLTRRMQARQTTLDISDLQENIEKAISGFDKNAPLNFRGEVSEKCAQDVLRVISQKIPSDQFEKLIKSFFETQGARATIPSRNQRDKQGDADVVAIYDLLNLIVFVQAKHHEGEVDAWAVKQIKDYRDSKINEDSIKDEFNQLTWVISTADRFSEDCIHLALEEGVRLINGIEFARMLLDAGMVNLSHLG